MNARQRRKQARAMAREATGPYVAENVRLERQEANRSGGGMAGWVRYQNETKLVIDKVTGRIERKAVYRIPRYMPTGTWAPRLDKKIP